MYFCRRLNKDSECKWAYYAADVLNLVPNIKSLLSFLGRYFIQLWRDKASKIRYFKTIVKQYNNGKIGFTEMTEFSLKVLIYEHECLKSI